MQDITITIVQSDLIWEQPRKNLDNFDKKLGTLKDAQDIIVLPEMFSTGFTMNVRQYAEDMNGATLFWMKEKAAGLNAAITGSFIFKSQNKYYNRLVWMNPDGSYKTYDKRHLFRFGNEHDYFEAGTEKIIVELNGWRFCPMICYDLRFPVWTKNRLENEKFQYDALIYVANWPEARKFHWQTLLKARAIENLSYVVGVNRIGPDGRGTRHSGNSIVISPKVETLCEIDDNAEEIKTITLSKSDLVKYREKFNVGLDWDDFQLL